MIKCLSVLEKVSNEVCKTFPNKSVNPEALNWISGICEMIDTIAIAYDGIAYDVSVDPDTMDIIVGLECNEIIVDGYERPNNIYEVIESSKKVTMYHGNLEESITIEFVFDGIWEDNIE